MRYNISFLAGNYANIALRHSGHPARRNLRPPTLVLIELNKNKQVTGNRALVGLRRLPTPISLYQVHPSSTSIYFHQARCNSKQADDSECACEISPCLPDQASVVQKKMFYYTWSFSSLGFSLHRHPKRQRPWLFRMSSQVRKPQNAAVWIHHGSKYCCLQLLPLSSSFRGVCLTWRVWREWKRSKSARWVLGKHLHLSKVSVPQLGVVVCVCVCVWNVCADVKLRASACHYILHYTIAGGLEPICLSSPTKL